MDELERSAATVNWATSLPSKDPLGSCIAYERVWLGLGDSLCGFDQFTGRQTHAIGKFGDGALVRLVRPFDGGFVVLPVAPR